MSNNQYRIAVIVGENCRDTTHNMESITCFLELFGVPYDIYACVDIPDKLKKYNNVVTAIAYEDVANTPRVKKMRETCMKFMRKAGWQFLKCNIAMDQIKNTKRYTHMLKLRTDCVFHCINVIHRHRPGWDRKDKILVKNNINDLIQIFKQTLQDMHNDQSMSAWGDKIALGKFNIMHDWLRGFVNVDTLSKIYKENPRMGPDQAAAGKSWRYIKKPVNRHAGVRVANRKLWKILNWFQLTWSGARAKKKSGVQEVHMRNNPDTNAYKNVINMCKVVRNYIKK